MILRFAPLLALTALLALAGCGTSASPLAGQDSERTLTLAANSSWLLASWTGADGKKHPLPDPVPTLHLGYSGRVSGHAGVNLYNGVARVAGSRLDWGPGFTSTLRAGPPELMESESRYLAELAATTKVTIRGDRLVLTGGKSLRLEFVRATP